MVKFINAKCPSCGASLNIDNTEDRVVCDYCKNIIIVNDALEKYKLEISGNISIEGISSNVELIESANELLEMSEYLKAKKKFLEFSERCPDNYQGWLGLLICRTRNFTIKDNNIMFGNDVNKYKDHFFKTAPEEVKNRYFELIDKYFFPEKYLEIERRKKMEALKKIKSETEHIDKSIKKTEDYTATEKICLKILDFFFAVGNVLLYLFGAILIFAYLTSPEETLILNIFAIMFGLSLFKIFYAIIWEKFNIDKKYYIIARSTIPFIILIIWFSYPIPENVKSEDGFTKTSITNNNQHSESTTLKSTTTTQQKDVYYIEYNKLGKNGKYKEYEKEQVIFYYLPKGKYNIEVTSLNEKYCFLWIDYRKGYKNGNFGTAYNNKEMLTFSATSKSNTTTIDDSVHIYNSNNCNYKLTKIK